MDTMPETHNFYGTNYTPQYKPLSPWAYVGYNLLFSIPVVGFILLIVFSFSSKNINRRNYARSFWCVLLLALIISVVLSVLAMVFGFSSEIMDGIQDAVNSIL